jgi:hypothetical protein
VHLLHAFVRLESDSRARSDRDADFACSTPVPRAGSFCGLTERTASRGMPYTKPARNARDYRCDVACPRLRGGERDALIVANASRDEDPTRIEQDVNKAKLLCLGHAPRMHVLATDSIGVLLLPLEHHDICATASQDQRNGRAGNSSADDHNITLQPHAPTSQVGLRKRLEDSLH